MPRTRRQALRRLVSIALITAVFGSTTLATVANNVSSDFAVISPGPALDLTDNLQGQPPDASYGSTGHFHMTTVQTTQLSVLSRALRRLSGEADRIIDIGPAGDEPSSPTAAVQMEASKRVALEVASAAVAGRSAAGDGAQLAQVLPDSPAEQAGLVAGDVVLAVGDVQVASATQLRAALEEQQPGAEVTLTVRSLTGALSRARSVAAQLDGSARLGVDVVSYLSAERLGQDPITVVTTGIGGPSAGLMLALGFTDALSAGDLTAGRTLAGTGTLDLSGEVGEVAGIAQKVQGAQAVGAAVFFVPASEAALARAAAPTGMTVVAVKTYADALRYLCASGGRSVACTN